MFGVYYLCVVLMVDISVILGMLICVFVLIFFYIVKLKGFSGLVKEYMFYFFNYWVFIFVNFIFESVILLVKLILLVFCLFGNMYVGELIFILIVVMYMVDNFVL